MDSLSVNVNDEAVSHWIASFRLVEYPQFCSLSEVEKVSYLTKISIILSKLWSSGKTLEDDYICFILNVLENEWINPKLCTLCLFCFKWCKDIEFSPMLATSISNTLQSQLSYLRSGWEQGLPMSEDVELKLLSVTNDLCQLLIKTGGVNAFNSDSFLQLFQSYLQCFQSILAVISSSPMKKIENIQIAFLISMNNHSALWSKLLSLFHISLFVQLFPTAFECISSLNQITSSKKIFSHELSNGIFYFWRLICVIFSGLSMQDAECPCLTINLGNSTSLVEYITLDPNNPMQIEKNKELFMNLVAPKDAVGLLTFPLTKLLKTSRWLTCVSYNNLISTMLQFPRWHQPHLMLKLCLRVLHHFLILPHMSNSTTNNNDNNSNSTQLSDHGKSQTICLETRIMQHAFLFLLLSLPKGESGWQILRSVGVSVPTVPRITMADIIEQTSKEDENQVHNLVHLERQLFSLHCRLVLCMRRCEESDCQLFYSVPKEAFCYSIDPIHANKVSSVDALRDLYMSSSFRYLPNDGKDCINPRIMQYLTYREQLRHGLFSFRNIFQRSDILSTTVREDKACQENGHSLESRVKEFNSMFGLCEQWMALFATSHDPKVDPLAMSDAQWTEAMEALGGLWAMQVYRTTRELFHELSRAASVSRHANNNKNIHNSGNKDIPSSGVDAFSSPVEFKAYFFDPQEQQSSTHIADRYSQGTQQQPFNFSQSWYQTTQLDTFFTNNSAANRAYPTNNNEQSSINEERDHCGYLRVSRVVKDAQKNRKEDNQVDGTSQSLPVKKDSEEENRSEQLVLAASHPLAIYVTYHVLTLVAKLMELFVSAWLSLDDSEHLPTGDTVNGASSLKSKLKVSVEKLLEPVIESLWWFFHRTSGFALDLQEIKPLQADTKGNLDAPSPFKDGEGIFRGLVASLTSIKGDSPIIPWGKLFRLDDNEVNTDHTAMDCVLGATWIYHLLFSLTQDDARSTDKESEESGLMATHTPRISMAMQKSMNSLTDAGLLPNVFATLAQLLRHCMLTYNTSDDNKEQKRRNEQLALLESGENVCDFIVPCAPSSEEQGNKSEWTLTFQFLHSKQATTDQSTSQRVSVKSFFTRAFNGLVGAHVNDFLRFAVCKMSSMVTNTAEQYTPDLLTNMTSGLKDIFTCVFLLQQFDAMVIKTQPVKSTLEEESTWMATESLFKLWVLLENLWYRYQYTLLFQQYPVSSVSGPAALDAAKVKHLTVEQVYDTQHLWPSMYFWVTSHHITTAAESDVMTRIYRMLRLYYLVRYQEAQEGSACRVALPVSQHCLTSVCSLTLGLWLNETSPGRETSVERVLMSCLWDTVAAVVSVSPGLCPGQETFHVPCHHQIYCHGPASDNDAVALDGPDNDWIEVNPSSCTWGWTDLCEMVVLVAVSRALHSCCRDMPTGEEEDTAVRDTSWRHICDMFVALNGMDASEVEHDRQQLSSSFGEVSLTQLVECLDKFRGDGPLSSLRRVDSATLRRQADEQLSVICAFYGVSVDNDDDDQTTQKEKHRTTCASSRVRLLVSRDTQKSLYAAVYTVLAYVSVLQRESLVLEQETSAVQMQLKCDVEDEAVIEPLALSTASVIAPSPAITKTSNDNNDDNAVNVMLQLPSMMDVAQETFYHVEASNNPVFSPERLLIKDIPMADDAVYPRKEEKEEDSEVDVERTTDVVDAKRMHKPVGDHVAAVVGGGGNSGHLMVGERLIFTDDDVCMTGLSGAHIIGGEGMKTAITVDKGDPELRDRNATLTEEDTQQPQPQEEEGSHLDDVDEKKQHEPATLLSHKRKREEDIMVRKDEEETYLTGSVPQEHQLDEPAEGTVQEKRQRTDHSRILCNDLVQPDSLWSTAEQTLTNLQVRWSQLVAAAGPARPSTSSTGPIEISQLQSLHELLQESHALSQTLHALTVQHMLSVTSQTNSGIDTKRDKNNH